MSNLYHLALGSSSQGLVRMRKQGKRYLMLAYNTLLLLSLWRQLECLRHTCVCVCVFVCVHVKNGGPAVFWTRFQLLLTEGWTCERKCTAGKGVARVDIIVRHERNTTIGLLSRPLILLEWVFVLCGLLYHFSHVLLAKRGVACSVQSENGPSSDCDGGAW